MNGDSLTGPAGWTNAGRIMLKPLIQPHYLHLIRWTHLTKKHIVKYYLLFNIDLAVLGQGFDVKNDFRCGAEIKRKVFYAKRWN